MSSSAPISEPGVNDGGASKKPRIGQAAGNVEVEVRQAHASFAWLLPWLLASIGFLLTLALLR
jgi:hypothetical protein